MMELIKLGTAAYISQKALKCFGKRDYADIIAFCGWCAVGIELYNIIINIYSAITRSELFTLFNSILNAFEKI